MTDDPDKPRCTCTAIAGDNRECPWHGVEAMKAYRDGFRFSTKERHEH
jgi:hypothetical protein